MIYTYNCKNCGNIEINHSMTESINTCPYCNETIQRVITGGSGFLLKGTGWYRDGYSSKKKENNDKSNS